MPHFTTRYDSLDVGGHRLFYREAGDPTAPTLVLLHGFPASSFMFRDLLADLSDEYHLVAPDHLGFGHSDAPPVDDFTYTFDALADLTHELLAKLGLDRYALYLQDYGAPIGFRIASDHPEQITAIVSQNGNAYLDGLTDFWAPLLAFARDGVTNAAAVRQSLELDGQRWVYSHGVPASRMDRLSPDTWTLDQARLDRPGNKDIPTRRCSATTGSTSTATRRSRRTCARTGRRCWPHGRALTRSSAPPAPGLRPERSRRRDPPARRRTLRAGDRRRRHRRPRPGLPGRVR